MFYVSLNGKKLIATLVIKEKRFEQVSLTFHFVTEAVKTRLFFIKKFLEDFLGIFLSSEQSQFSINDIRQTAKRILSCVDTEVVPLNATLLHFSF